MNIVQPLASFTLEWRRLASGAVAHMKAIGEAEALGLVDDIYAAGMSFDLWPRALTRLADAFGAVEASRWEPKRPMAFPGYSPREPTRSSCACTPRPIIP